MEEMKEEKIVLTKRMNNFGIIRLVAAIAVIIGHMYVLTGMAPPALLGRGVHEFGVAVFFVIGGYLITISWLNNSNVIQYLIKRIFRIFPALIICILMTTFMLGPCLTKLSLREYFSSPILFDYLRNMYLHISYNLPGVFENNIYPNAVNGSIWCLPIEFLMYLIVPVYLWIGMRLSGNIQKCYFSVITLLVIILGVVYRAGFVNVSFIILGMDLGQIINIMPYYFVGSLFAVCKLEKYLSLQFSAILFLVSCMLIMLPISIFSFLMYVFIPYFILSLALAEKPLFFRLNHIDISYGMFLYSFVIQQTLVDFSIKHAYTINGENIFMLMFLTIILSGLAGLFIWRLIEIPIMNVQRKLIDRIVRKGKV